MTDVAPWLVLIGTVLTVLVGTYFTMSSARMARAEAEVATYDAVIRDLCHHIEQPPPAAASRLDRLVADTSAPLLEMVAEAERVAEREYGPMSDEEW